jgi:protein-tyrosine kinase
MKPQEGQISIMPSRVPPARPLGMLLVEQGKITTEDVARVLTLAHERDLKFGEAARSLGLVCASDVEQAIAWQYDYKYLQPGQGDYALELYMAYDPFGNEAENLRQLRNLLIETWFERGNKGLAITALSNEAPCSMFCANLALAFAQLGMRTLLVDANLRRPRQDDIFRCQAGRGLTDILVGRAEPEALFPLPHFPSLHVLAAGTLPPNPHELLGRPNCRNFFAHVKEQFDVVLFDTPAFTLANEAFTVGARAGGVLLICERDQTRLQDLQAVSARLASTGTSVVGSVLCE